MRKASWLLLVTLIAAGAVRPAQGGKPLVLTVSPTMAFAPATLRVQARVAPHADNRLLEVAVDSMNFYRCSTLQIDGDRAPRVFVMDFPGVPGGEYDVTAALMDDAGHVRATDRRTATVE